MKLLPHLTEKINIELRLRNKIKSLEAQLKALQSKIDTAVEEIEPWQPKEGEWVIPNFEKDENSITAYKVKEVISYNNPKTNIVVCYNNVTLKLSQVSPFYFEVTL